MLYVVAVLLAVLAASPAQAASVTGSGGGVTGWPTSSATKEITWANSFANAARIGATSTGRYWALFDDATDGLTFDCVVATVQGACDKGTKISATYKWFIADASNNKLFNFEPNASASTDQYKLGTKKAKVAFMVPLNPRGAATSNLESILTNQPSDYYLTVTDANTDAADFTFFVTNRMAGATTATFRLVGVSKHATPSGNIDLDCAMSAFTPGTDTYTAHVTTGEQTALLTPATQYRPVAVTTSAHTINGGALVAGDVVKGSCEVDATATTSAQMTDFRLEAWVLVTLDVNSMSD